MILVVGSTGDLGRAIVRRLVEGGEAVRCLVRPGSDRSALPDVVEDVEGDLTDPASLRRACRQETSGAGNAMAMAHGTGPRTGTRILGPHLL